MFPARRAFRHNSADAGWADLAGLGIEQPGRVLVGRLGYAPDAQVTDGDRVAMIAFCGFRQRIREVFYLMAPSTRRSVRLRSAPPSP